MPVSVDPLDNIVWHALTTEHSGFAQGIGAARRYEPEVSVFAAVESFGSAGWADLAALVEPGHAAVLFRDDIPAPPSDWTEVARGTGLQMLFQGPLPAVSERNGMRELDAADVAEMVALVELTQPGPFASRTIELGGYLGVFDDEGLVAMAGRRFHIGGFAEVSAVCTHPRAQRRGLGAALTMQVAARIAAEGRQPMLHVAATNTGAQRVYERLGFVTRRTVMFAAVRTPAATG